MILAPYNPEWSAEFPALRAVYLSSLGELVFGVEHLGVVYKTKREKKTANAIVGQPPRAIGINRLPT
jgi:hypothetical protein